MLLSLLIAVHLHVAAAAEISASSESMFLFLYLFHDSIAFTRTYVTATLRQVVKLFHIESRLSLRIKKYPALKTKDISSDVTQ